MDENLVIVSGDYEVLFSGTVIGIENEPITFQFPKNRGSLKFVIKFLRDESQIESHFKFFAPNDKELEIMLVNFSESLGTGNTFIYKIGNSGNRALFFNCRVFAIKGISNTLHYTFYLGKEISNDTK